MFLALLLLLNVGQLCWAKNYDRLFDRIAAANEAMRDEFIRNNRGGKMVFDRLESDEFTNQHPLLGSYPENQHEISDDQWLAFLDELGSLRGQAENPPAFSYQPEELHTPPQEETSRQAEYYTENDDMPAAATSNPMRRNEVPNENQLWGVHKVSGGSGENGQWIDYALLGAGSQDMEDTDDAVERLSGDIPVHFGREVMKNDSLPTYCSPPNPCPLNYHQYRLSTPCDSHFSYTKEFNKHWILEKVANGECTCDTEHMQSCSNWRPNRYRSDEDIRTYFREGDRVSLQVI